jgi:cytochrome c
MRSKVKGAGQKFRFEVRVWRTALLIVLLAAWSVTFAQSGPKTIWDGVYTEAQAVRGEQAYKLSCGYCHKDDLTGGFFDDGTGRAPALAGPRAFDSSFEERWRNLTVREMLLEIGSKMPQQDPGSLTVKAYTDIVSYLLSKNGVPKGTEELPPDLDKLDGIRITPKPAGSKQ